MLYRLLLLLAFAVSSWGSVIDSGAIFNRNTFGAGDADTWNGTMASSTVNYSVQFTTDGAASVICILCDCPVACDVGVLPGEGSVVSISAFTISDYGMTGSAIVSGVAYPNVVFRGMTQSGMFFSSSVRLVSSPFVFSRGTFSVPFTMTGLLNASAGDALVLTEQISGSGRLTFRVESAGGQASGLDFMPMFPDNHQFMWTFAPEPVPEPETLLMAGGALIYLAVRRGLRVFESNSIGH